MRARVTNLGRGARGFHTEDRGTVLLDPGASTVLNLAPHPVHEAWAASGEIGLCAEEGGEPPPPRVRATGRPPAPRARDA